MSCDISLKAQDILLSGSDWQIKDIPNDTTRVFCNDWIPAIVPGNIQADLEASEYLKPLWYGEGDSCLHAVAWRDWWYRKDFIVPSAFTGRCMTIVFDGVDSECEVWLNGVKIGEHAGMFKRFRFDVTEAIRPGKENRIEVRIAGM
ncbi:MAG: glycosyl hydrolase 2 galactose-binding domain-containing protein, partial [Bacteroidales bacterium]